MIPTLKIILLLAGALWGLASLVFVLALCRGAARPTPEMNCADQWQAQVRARRRAQRRAEREPLHSAQS